MPSTGHFHGIHSSAVEIPRAKHVTYLNFTNISNGSTKQRLSSPSHHPAVTPRDDSTQSNSYPSPPTSQTQVAPTGNARPPPFKQLDDIRKLSVSVTFKNGEYVFLVAKEWWDHWVICCKNNISDVPEINNWSLIDKSQIQIEKHTDAQELTQGTTSQTRYALRKDIKPDLDFKILNVEAWTALHSWYAGGPPLPRLVTLTYTEASSVRTDLYSSLMTASSPPQVDLWSQPPPCLAEAISKDRRNLYSDCNHTVSEKVDGRVNLVSPQIVRVESFNFNDCGMSITEASDQENPTNTSSSSSFDSAAPLACNDGSDSDRYVDKDISSEFAIPPHNPSGTSARGPRQVSLTQINSCFVCRAVALQRCTQCSAVYYCGIPCQRSHWKFHKKWCAVAKLHSALPAAEFARVVPVGRRGQVGLQNLGNSCYLNSSLQCLSHLLPLTTYFLSDRYKQELNTASLDGTGGRLAVEYASLMQELWFESKSAVSAADLKSLLGKIRPEYAGYLQHDAHEVIELLLDKLHEDLNRVTKKPYVERPEGDGSNDAAVAADAWSKHLLRENSVVTELVGSQMRSQLTCPDCGKVSVFFEYQQTLQVAIPRVSVTKTLQIIYVPNEIPKVFTRSISNTTYGLNRLLYCKQLVMRPVQLAVQLDPMQQLGVAVRKVSDAIKQYSISIETEVKQVLAEVQRYDNQAGGSTDTIRVFFNSSLELYKSSDIVLFEMAAAPNTTKPNIVQSFIEFDKPLIKLPNDITIAAYNISASSTNNILLLQRKVDDTFLNSLAASLGSRLPTLRQVEPAFSVVGSPLIVPCDPKWTCGKVRHFVWQYISRVLTTDPALIVAQGASDEVVRQAVAAIREAEAKTDIKQQLFFSRLLPLRMVDQSGRPAHSTYWKQLYNGSAHSSQRVGPTTAAESAYVNHFDGSRSGSSGLLAHDTFLGASVPDDKNITLAQFFGNDEEFFTLSVDWSGNWLKVLSEGELKAISKHDSCSLLQASSRTGSSSTGNLTLEKCLEEHTREETLDEVNGWYCTNCKTHKCARKNVTFWAPSLPTVLIVVLKRFEFKDLGTTFGQPMSSHREKIDAFVDFPMNGLDLTKFCGNSLSGGNHFNGEGNSRSVYDLFAVCNHFGRMGFGHYTAYARDWKAETLSDTWMSFDDTDVEKCKDPANVVSRAAYILMYRRRP